MRTQFGFNFAICLVQRKKNSVDLVIYILPNLHWEFWDWKSARSFAGAMQGCYCQEPKLKQESRCCGHSKSVHPGHCTISVTAGLCCCWTCRMKLWTLYGTACEWWTRRVDHCTFDDCFIPQFLGILLLLACVNVVNGAFESLREIGLWKCCGACVHFVWLLHEKIHAGKLRVTREYIWCTS